MFSPDDLNDRQVELGFMKFKLYDRMIDLCTRSMILFAAMIESENTDASFRQTANELGTAMNEVLTTESEVAEELEQQFMEQNFEHNTMN